MARTSVCPENGCPELTTNGKRCPTHRSQRYRQDRAHRGSTTQRGLGWTHQQLTADTIKRQPWCTLCGQTQREVEARGDKLTGGHIIARTDGGTNTPDNYRTECGHCNYGRRQPGAGGVPPTDAA